MLKAFSNSPNLELSAGEVSFPRILGLRESKANQVGGWISQKSLLV